MADSPAAGELRRFILEQLPVRGFWLRLTEPWQELRRHQHYAPSVEVLLGQAVSASVLLAATLKFRGTLTLQLSGDGLVSLLVAQCTHDFSIRAVARAPEIVVGAPAFRQLVGDGRLSVTVEADDERASRYQGIVALEGDSLAQCLENYFTSSEQLPTSIVLAADAQTSGGLLLQHLPQAGAAAGASGALSAATWDELSARVADLSRDLLSLPAAEPVLARLCAQHDCRLFAASPVQFACRCDPGKVQSVLRALGAEELRSILDEQGMVSVICEFCGRPYRFDAADVEGLLVSGIEPEPGRTLN